MVDAEADGPIPGDYSMVCFGAVVVEPSLEKAFYGRLKPISEKWLAKALAVSGFSRGKMDVLSLELSCANIIFWCGLPAREALGPELPS